MKVALLAVFLTIRYTALAACPTPPPQVIENGDGTYRYEYSNTINLPVCYETVERVEEWSDTPENGGAYIRTVPK